MRIGLLPERPIVLKKRPAGYFPHFRRPGFAAFKAPFPSYGVCEARICGGIQFNDHQFRRALLPDIDELMNFVRMISN